MTPYENWFLDFDETLATSAITWGLDYAFPKLIAQHRLSNDLVRFHQAILVAQERTNRESDLRSILYDLFEALDWPHELEDALMGDIFTNYQPELFDDAVPFLEQLRQKGRKVYIVSNNPISPKHIEALDLGRYVTQIFTPKLYPNCQPKPHRSLWDAITASYAEINPRTSVFIGDDPWSDGAFAENCDLPCWLVDRMDRFGALHAKQPYRRVRSLLEIPIS